MSPVLILLIYMVPNRAITSDFILRTAPVAHHYFPGFQPVYNWGEIRRLGSFQSRPKRRQHNRFYQNHENRHTAQGIGCTLDAISNTLVTKLPRWQITSKYPSFWYFHGHWTFVAVVILAKHKLNSYLNVDTRRCHWNTTWCKLEVVLHSLHAF